MVDFPEGSLWLWFAGIAINVIIPTATIVLIIIAIVKHFRKNKK
jgi:hypothetical protein